MAVIVATPIQTFLARRELGKYRQYIAVDTVYIQNLAATKPSIHMSGNKRRLLVTYAFYSDSFDTSGDPEALEDALMNSFRLGGLVDFDESSGTPWASEEKLTKFYSKLVSQFVRPKGLSVCFSKGKKFIECIMVSFDYQLKGW